MKKWISVVLTLVLSFSALGAFAGGDGDGIRFFTGYVFDATMNAIVLENYYGDRCAFSKGGEADTSGLENGLLIGNCVTVGYTGEIDWANGDASKATLVSVSDGVCEDGSARLIRRVFLEGMEEETYLSRYAGPGFSLWYESGSFRPAADGEGEWTLLSRDGDATAYLRIRKVEDVSEPVELTLAYRQFELEDEGYSVERGGVVHIGGEEQAHALWLANGEGQARDVVAVETDAGERFLLEAAYAVEATEGYGAKLWNAILSFAPLDADGRVAATVFGPDEEYNWLIGSDKAVIDTPQGLLDALYETGALPERVLARRFELGEKTGELDLSANFASLLSGTGTAGERMYMGAVVNTFLTFYGLEEISVTSAGKQIETGHAIYDTPLLFYHSDEA